MKTNQVLLVKSCYWFAGGQTMKKNLCKPTWAIKKRRFCTNGAGGRGKAPGRANSHEIPDASCQSGDRPRQLPKSRASPHSSKAGRGRTAKASPNVKWHLLNTRRGRECFYARVPDDLCGPSCSAKPRAAVFLFILVSSCGCVLMPLQISPVIRSQVRIVSDGADK